MALVNGPLFSLEASGQVGKAIVYSKWKGRAYVREYVIPSNPRSLAQLIQRGTLGVLSKWWAALPDDPNAQSSWDADAATKSVSPFNAMLSDNLVNMRDDQWTTGHVGGGQAAGAGLTSVTAAAIAPGKAVITITPDAATNASDLWLVAIGTAGGANTTSQSLARVIGGTTNHDSDDPQDVEIDNLPPGTYFFSAAIQGTLQFSSAGWTSTATGLVVT